MIDNLKNALTNDKSIFCIASGVSGGIVAYLLGGWSSALIALLILMGLDYVTGLIVAGVFKKSPKTEDGSLESKAGLKGLLRKFACIGIVVMANQIDLVTGTNYLRDAVCIALVTNEAISLIENFGLMGVPIPQKLKNAITVLKDNDGSEDTEKKK